MVKYIDSNVTGINRGIFGVPSKKKSEIIGLVKRLESQNPTTNPTENLDKVNGRHFNFYCKFWEYVLQHLPLSV